jgi:hypothetical protein
VIICYYHSITTFEAPNMGTYLEFSKDLETARGKILDYTRRDVLAQLEYGAVNADGSHNVMGFEFIDPYASEEENEDEV